MREARGPEDFGLPKVEDETFFDKKGKFDKKLGEYVQPEFELINLRWSIFRAWRMLREVMAVQNHVDDTFVADEEGLIYQLLEIYKWVRLLPNWSKVELPKELVVILGYLIDFGKKTIGFTDERLEKVLEGMQRMIDQREMTAINILTMLGRAHAIARIVRDAKPFLCLASRWAAKKIGTISTKELWRGVAQETHEISEQTKTYIREAMDLIKEKPFAAAIEFVNVMPNDKTHTMSSDASGGKHPGIGGKGRQLLSFSNLHENLLDTVEFDRT